MTFDPPFPVFVIVALGVAAISAAIWREFSREKRRLHPAWLHPPCLLLRFAAIAALILLLLNPSRRVSSGQSTSGSVILLDASASMSLAADEKNRSRWESANAFAHSALEKMAAAGLGEPKLFTFSAGLDVTAAAVKPAGRETNLAGALERLLAGSREEAPGQIIVVSDGRIHDRERLGAALSLAKAAQVPVSTRIFGIDRPPRNASLVAVEAPRMVRPRSPVSVHVDVAGTGIGPGESLNLKLRGDDRKVLTQKDFHLTAGPGDDSDNARPAEQTLVFDSGLRTGRYHLELTTPGEPEVDLDDNRFSFTVEIATGKLRVLYAEGTHEKRPVGNGGHFWNSMEHKTRAFDAAGDIEYECLTPVDNRNKFPNLVGVTFQNGEMRTDPARDFPKTRKDLHQFDVLLMCGIQKGNFSGEQLQWVVDWVLNRGGGFMMGGGGNSFDRGEYDKTPWERIIPVDMKGYGHGLYNVQFDIDVPKAVRGHPIWTISPDRNENDSILDTIPYFLGMNRVLRAKPGALLLATRREIGEPIIAVQRYGRGRSLAFLPDTNGAWGRQFIDWGPPDEPQMKGFMHLGLGEAFVFNEAAAVIPPGDPPKNPGSWYGRFWVNAVRWLGQSSVRWQRDKLAGRVVSAQARPAEKLPVAAEVLAVHELDEILALDVGARLDLPGARRVRLLYDRDRREFTGELSVPASAAERTGIGVLFDVMVNGRTFSQAVKVGVHQGNPEYAQSSPDPGFMADLARATNGTVLRSVADAVAASREAAERRARQSRRSWSEPLWPEWWLWGLIAALLGAEWSLRRRGGRIPIEKETETEIGPAAPMFSAGRKAVLIACAILFSAGSAVFSQEEKSIAGWIEQLGADRVRLRDEAEDYLRKTPDAHEALEIAAKSAENEEIRVRAENISRFLKRSHRWKLVATRAGHTPDIEVANRALVATPDKKRFFSRGRDHVRVYDSATLTPGVIFSDSNYQVTQDWLQLGPSSTLAISPDGQRIVSTNEYAEIIVHDAVRIVEKVRFSAPKAATYIQKRVPNTLGTIFSAAYFNDNKTLVIGERSGVRLWNTETQEEIWFVPTKGPGFAVAVAPDQSKVIVSVDTKRVQDLLVTFDAKTGERLAETNTPFRLGGLLFDSSGKKLLVDARDGLVRIYEYSPGDGSFGIPRTYGPNGKFAEGVAWGPDETTILTSSLQKDAVLAEWDVKTGKQIWQAPSFPIALYRLAWISGNRLVASGENGLVTVWQFTDL